MGRSRSPPSVDDLIASKPVAEVRKELLEMTKNLKTSLIQVFELHKSIVRGYQLVEGKNRDNTQMALPGPGSSHAEDLGRICSEESLCSAASPDMVAFAALQKKVDDQELQLIKLKEHLGFLSAGQKTPPRDKLPLHGPCSSELCNTATTHNFQEKGSNVVKDQPPAPDTVSTRRPTPSRSPVGHQRRFTSGRGSTPASVKSTKSTGESESGGSLVSSAGSSEKSGDINERRRSKCRTRGEGVRIRLDDPRRAQVDKEKLMNMIKEKIAFGCLDNIFHSGQRHTAKNSGSESGEERPPKKKRKYRKRKSRRSRSRRRSAASGRSHENGSRSKNTRSEKSGK